MLIAPHFFTEDAGIASIVEAQEGLRDRRSAREAGALARRRRQRLQGLERRLARSRIPQWDITEYLAYIRVPILIVQGEDDQYGTVKQIEIAQQECYCPVEVALLPGARHSPQREAPEATLEGDDGIHRPRIAKRNGRSRPAITTLKIEDYSAACLALLPCAETR